MVEYGKTNSLKVVRTRGSEIILDGGELGEIFLSEKDIPRRCRANDKVDLFIYVNPKDKIIFSAGKPYAEAGQFALLKVVSSNSYGAFLDWGLEHDLRVPVKEQQKPMRQGHYYVVYVFNEKNNRTAASSRLTKFLKSMPADFKEGQRVDLVIGDVTPLGYRAIINGTHLGVLYKNEVFQLLEQGQPLKGYIKKIREDGKIDLSLQKRSARETDDLQGKILALLKEKGGTLDISDKTSPEKIYSLFGVSKKRYKSAVGALYKKRLIVVEDYSIRIADGYMRNTPGARAGKKIMSRSKIKTGKKIKKG
jgi:predicted RNA-binding protein (virulence factor B family)